MCSGDGKRFNQKTCRTIDCNENFVPRHGVDVRGCARKCRNNVRPRIEGLTALTNTQSNGFQDFQDVV